MLLVAKGNRLQPLVSDAHPRLSALILGSTDSLALSTSKGSDYA
jgi:hypothetical protein